MTASKRSLVERFIVAAFVVPLFLGGCAAGTNMIAKDAKPPLAVKSDRAVLVIVRTTSFMGGYVVNNYLDGKLIGQTQFKSYFTTDVKPGTHYVISRADNTDAARINFEAGRIYFLQQGIYPGWNATTRYSPMTLNDAKKELAEASYLIYDTQRPGNDMSDKDFKEAKGDFEKENKEDPTRYKDVIEYKGHKLSK